VVSALVEVDEEEEEVVVVVVDPFSAARVLRERSASGRKVCFPDKRERR
jgi:hypothetical protein